MNSFTLAAQGPDSGRSASATAGERPGVALQLENLSRRFDGCTALDFVSLRVEAAEILAVVGHSGCGKTTLLRVIAGVERPSSGRVLLGSREVAGPTGFVAPEHRGVGMVFQDYALFPHLTVHENVLFGLRRYPTSQAHAMAHAALDEVGLAAYADRYPHMLSGGEQQRVAVARALAPRPGVVLLDEPFSNLDRRLRDSIRDQTAAALRHSGATAIIVTHDAQEAMCIADRIALMRGGRIVQIAPAEDLYRRPASLFAARFFSELNELPGVCADGHVTTPLGRFPAPALTEGEQAVVCVRPHDLRPAPVGSGAVARVLTRSFLGEIDHLSLAVEGLEAPLRMHLFGRSGLAAGDVTGVTADARDILIFPSHDDQYGTER